MNTISKNPESKLKKHWLWIKEYLVEISVVVISIALTFYGDSLIEKYNNKQEDREMMELVTMELEANKKELTKLMSFYQKDFEMGNDFFHFLKGSDTLSKDSLEKHLDQHRLFYYWFFKNNAFDILRSSGTMQRTEKALLMSLLESYEQLSVVKSLDERYMHQKSNHILNFRYNLPDGKYGETTVEQWEQIKADAEFKQFLSNTMPLLSVSIMQATKRAIELINMTLEEIGKQYE